MNKTTKRRQKPVVKSGNRSAKNLNAQIEVEFSVVRKITSKVSESVKKTWCGVVRLLNKCKPHGEMSLNRPPGDWPGLFPDQVLANSLMDRLAHKAQHIPMKGESYRKRGRPQRPITN